MRTILWKLLLVIGFIGIGIFWMTGYELEEKRTTYKRGKIAIYRKGFALNFDVPNFKRFGLENAGMFGMFPLYLKKAGYKVDMIDAIDESVC